MKTIVFECGDVTYERALGDRYFYGHAIEMRDTWVSSERGVDVGSVRMIEGELHYASSVFKDMWPAKHRVYWRLVNTKNKKKTTRK